MPSNTFAWRDLLNRRMLICIFIGFSSGLPLFILINLLAAWLRSEGVDLKSIGLFALIQFPYTWKFLWSPLMDRYALGRLGRRRGWMLATQVLLLLAVAAFGLFNPRTDLWTIAVPSPCSSSERISRLPFQTPLLHPPRRHAGRFHIRCFPEPQGEGQGSGARRGGAVAEGRGEGVVR